MNGKHVLGLHTACDLLTVTYKGIYSLSSAFSALFLLKKTDTSR